MLLAEKKLDFKWIPVQIVPLKVPQCRHVLIEDINLVEAAGLDRGGDMTSLGAKLEDLRVDRDVEVYEVLDDLVRGLPFRVGQLALNLLELCNELIRAQTSHLDACQRRTDLATWTYQESETKKNTNWKYCLVMRIWFDLGLGC